MCARVILTFIQLIGVVYLLQTTVCTLIFAEFIFRGFTIFHLPISGILHFYINFTNAGAMVLIEIFTDVQNCKSVPFACTGASAYVFLMRCGCESCRTKLLSRSFEALTTFRSAAHAQCSLFLQVATTYHQRRNDLIQLDLAHCHIRRPRMCVLCDQQEQSAP